jgi:hypothetical protein
MKTSATTDTSETTLKSQNSQKMGRFDPALWEQWQAFLFKQGARVQTFMDRLIDDCIKGHYIHLHNQRPEIVLELDRRAEESGTTTDALVTRIISDWGVQKMTERKDAAAQKTKTR